MKTFQFQKILTTCFLLASIHCKQFLFFATCHYPRSRLLTVGNDKLSSWRAVVEVVEPKIGVKGRRNFWRAQICATFAKTAPSSPLPVPSFSFTGFSGNHVEKLSFQVQQKKSGQLLLNEGRWGSIIPPCYLFRGGFRARAGWRLKGGLVFIFPFIYFSPPTSTLDTWHPILSAKQRNTKLGVAQRTQWYLGEVDNDIFVGIGGEYNDDDDDVCVRGRMLLDGGDAFALASPASLAFSASLTHLQMQ